MAIKKKTFAFCLRQATYQSPAIISYSSLPTHIVFVNAFLLLLDIPLNVIAADKVAFMTANMNFIRRTLGSPYKRQLVEGAINRHGFDHLIKLLGVTTSDNCIIIE